MKIFTRRDFARNTILSSAALNLGPKLFSKAKDDPERFQIGIQEYTFHRWIGSGKLDHLDYPALAKKELGITHIEYWNRPFNGKHTDKKYVGELAKRTTGEGMKNVLILVDARHQLDASAKDQRDKAVEEHKGWIDCAAQLGCDAIRVNCRSGGNPDLNLKNASDGVGRLCDYAKGSKVKVVIEPHLVINSFLNLRVIKRDIFFKTIINCWSNNVVSMGCKTLTKRLNMICDTKYLLN